MIAVIFEVWPADGRKDDYLNCMKEIYNHDYGFRDVAHRVESSYQTSS